MVLLSLLYNLAVHSCFTFSYLISTIIFNQKVWLNLKFFKLYKPILNMSGWRSWVQLELSITLLADRVTAVQKLTQSLHEAFNPELDPDVLHNASLWITLKVPEVVGTENWVTSNILFLLDPSSIAKLLSYSN